MIETGIIKALLEEGESEVMDYKQEYSKSLNCYIHDILCLLNSDAESDRYLIFGVEDKTKKILGIQDSPHRNVWAEEKFQNWLVSVNFNRQPNIKFKEIDYNDRKLGVLVIRNRHDKPFYLLTNKDKAKAYRIYTRKGSSNTPHDRSADEVSIENMWRERFGINLSPKERLERLISSHEDWYKNPTGQIVHNEYSEFSIHPIEEYEVFEQQNVFRKKIKIPSLSKNDFFKTYHIYYFNVLILKARIIYFDDWRYIMPAFDHQVYEGDVNEIYVKKDSTNYNVYRILCHLEDGLDGGWTHIP